MEKAIMKSVEVPMFALVELMCHTRHDCALIMPVKVAGIELTSVTFAEEQWRPERGEYRSAIDTKYYGKSAFYCITPMSAADELAKLDEGEPGIFAGVLKLLAPETAVLANITPTFFACEKAADLIAMAGTVKEEPVEVPPPTPGCQPEGGMADLYDQKTPL